MAKLGVSILSEINNDFIKTVSKIIKNKINWIHYDIMDGKFVHNKSFEIEAIINCLKQNKKHFVDLHLMVNDPEYYLNKLGKYADLFIFHHEALSYESGKELIDIIRSQKNKIMVGIAINPQTNVEQIYEYLSLIDYVLIMSVVPGKGGQQFIPSSLNKVHKIKEYIKKLNLKVKIGIDGGVNNENAQCIARAGANVLISGSYITSGNIKKNIFSINKKIK